jgi:hypothetical protein
MKAAAVAVARRTRHVRGSEVVALVQRQNQYFRLRQSFLETGKGAGIVEILAIQLHRQR